MTTRRVGLVHVTRASGWAGARTMAARIWTFRPAADSAFDAGPAAALGAVERGVGTVDEPAAIDLGRGDLAGHADAHGEPGRDWRGAMLDLRVGHDLQAALGGALGLC